jgi:hypothetical protein
MFQAFIIILYFKKNSSSVDFKFISIFNQFLNFQRMLDVPLFSRASCFFETSGQKGVEQSLSYLLSHLSDRNQNPEHENTKLLGESCYRKFHKPTLSVEQLDCSFRWFIDEIVEGVRDTLLPNGDAIVLLRDGVLLNENARPTLSRVRDANLKAFDKVPRLTSLQSMPISCDSTVTTNFSYRNTTA